MIGKHTDRCGIEIQRGSFVAYATQVGDSPQLRVGVVWELAERKAHGWMSVHGHPPEKTIQLITLHAEKLVTIGKISSNVIVVDAASLGDEGAQLMSKLLERSKK